VRATASEARPKLRRQSLERVPGKVRYRNVAALLQEHLRDPGADRTRSSSDQPDMPRERSLGLAQLRMLEAVVFHVEELFLGKAFIGADRADDRLDPEGMRRDIERDRRPGNIAAGAESAEAGHQHDAR
jgi:hypothetical protein